MVSFPNTANAHLTYHRHADGDGECICSVTWTGWWNTPIEIHGGAYNEPVVARIMPDMVLDYEEARHTRDCLAALVTVANKYVEGELREIAYEYDEPPIVVTCEACHHFGYADIVACPNCGDNERVKVIG